MKIYIAQVRENTFDNPVDSFTHIQSFRFEDDATAWALGKVDEIKKEYPDTIETEWGADDINEKHVSYRVEEQTPVGYEDSYPCVMASREDFESRGYDTSGLDEQEFERIVDKMGEVLVGELYWDALEGAAEYNEIPKKDVFIPEYHGERYAEVSIKWDEDGEECDRVILIGTGLVEDSYEDQHSVFHCETFDEFEEIVKHGTGDFHITEVYGFTNNI